MREKKWRKLYSINAQFICPYCLQPFPIKKATIEHEPPKSRQKELGESKLYLACKKCNNEKGALTAEEYALWKTTKNYQIWTTLEQIRNGNTKGV